MEIGLNCALFVGVGRLAATGKVTDDLPGRSQGEDLITPWGGESVVVRSMPRR